MATCVELQPTGPPLGNDAHRYACKSYANKLLHNLHSLWQSQNFCDVEISAGSYVVKAHRSILSAASAYFQAMFTGGLAEETQTSIEIKSVSAIILSQLINFVYTGNFFCNIMK